MAPSIRVKSPTAGERAPRRLNLFPGRYLSEREFERLQAYPEARLAPLLETLPPGIVSGLEVRQEKDLTRLRIQPGSGVAAGGRLIRLVAPLDVEWNDLVSVAERSGAVEDGYHLLTVRSLVLAWDDAPDADPCTRTDRDPTRDRRWEVVTVPGLRLLKVPEPWLGLPQAKACARIAASFLDTPPVDPAGGSLCLALVRVAGKIAQWVDPHVGRLLCEPHAAARSFRRFTEAHFRSWARMRAEGNPAQRLGDVLGLDMLPAAASQVPWALVKHLAERRPSLGFDARDLRVDVVPVPASTLSAVIDGELERGTVDLMNRRGDHLRFLLAVPDLDYRPDLLDRPQRDLELERQLFRLGGVARMTWLAWRLQWQKINRLSPLMDPDGEVPPPAVPEGFRNALVARRRVRLGSGEALPEPYISHHEAPYPLSFVANPPANLAGESMAETRKRLTDALNALERAQLDGKKLLDELDAQLQLQRHQLDTLSISFSTLAGGVAGDGSGAELLRWSSSARLQPSKAST